MRNRDAIAVVTGGGDGPAYWRLGGGMSAGHRCRRRVQACLMGRLTDLPRYRSFT